jgi:aspartate racemase
MSRTIGLIGGMSWESTATYYRAINELVRARHGGLTSADILMRSVNFAEIVALQKAGRWDTAAERLGAIAQGLASIGAGCVLICTNTMHLVAEEVAALCDVPLIHIVDVTGAALRAAGATRPLLLATKYTMEEGFYLRRLHETCGIEALVPEAADRDIVHSVIFDELCQGIVLDSSRAEFVRIIERARQRGADSVILGCTEIGLLITTAQSPLPAFDSTLIHAEAAVDFVETAGDLEQAAA